MVLCWLLEFFLLFVCGFSMGLYEIKTSKTREQIGMISNVPV